MSDNRMSEIIKSSLEGIKGFADVDTVIGRAITTPTGVTIIPVSKVTVGFASGGVDYGTKKAISPQNFGGGGGTGVSIVPIAFLTVGRDAEINLVPINSGTSDVDRVVSLIENSPKIIEKIKESLL